MNGSRLGRAARGRFLIGFGALVFTVIFFIMFHTTQQQLDETRRNEQRCQLQQESLNIQLQVLEKKAQSEQQHHVEQSHNLERQAQEIAESKEKSVHDTNLKLTSLQQHYKLLQSQHDDYKEECTKTNTKQLEKIKFLENNVKKLESKNEYLRTQQKDNEMWKEKYNALLNEKKQLDRNNLSPSDRTEIIALNQQIDQYKEHCSWRPFIAKSSSSTTKNNMYASSTVEKNFNAQIPLGNNLYAIPIKYGRKIASTEGVKPIVFQQTSAKTNVTQKTTESNKGPVGIGNLPLMETSSTTAKARKASQMDRGQIKIPSGVVPFENHLDDNQLPIDNNEVNQLPANQMPEPALNAKKRDSADALKTLKFSNADDIGAREENDSNDFPERHESNLQKAMEKKKSDITNNAAEEEFGPYDSNNYGNANNDANDDLNENDDLQVIHGDEDKLPDGKEGNAHNQGKVRSVHL